MRRHQGTLQLYLLLLSLCLTQRKTCSLHKTWQNVPALHLDLNYNTADGIDSLMYLLRLKGAQAATELLYSTRAPPTPTPSDELSPPTEMSTLGRSCEHLAKACKHCQIVMHSQAACSEHWRSTQFFPKTSSKRQLRCFLQLLQVRQH